MSLCHRRRLKRTTVIGSDMNFMIKQGHIDSHLAMELIDLNLLHDKECHDTQFFAQSSYFSSQFEGKCSRGLGRY